MTLSFTTKAVNDKVIPLHANDGAFEPNFRWAAVEDRPDAVTQLRLDVVRSRGADISKRVGAGCRQREVE